MSSEREFLSRDKAIRWGLGFIGVYFVSRIITLYFSQFDLYPDESQYWVWSWSLDWGYFSKPPLIAWMIAASTSVLGNTDFAIRLASPVFHAIGAFFMMLTAIRLAGPRDGLVAALFYLLMPGIVLGSHIISTDSLLLPIWAAALYLLVRIRAGSDNPVFYALMGACIGFGFLAKYAAIYFIIGLGLAIVIDGPTRDAMMRWRALITVGFVLLLLGPNLYWNATNSFATLQHTAANANWSMDFVNVDNLFEFLGGQLAVFGFIAFPVLLWTLVDIWRRDVHPRTRALRFLSLFVIPVLVAVSVQAFLSRAHANWAATAYVAGTMLLVIYVVGAVDWRRIVLPISFALGAFGLVAFSAFALYPPVVDMAGLSNTFKRVRGWEDTTAAILQAGQEAEYAAIVFDDRNAFHQMQRYGQRGPAPLSPPIYMWQRFADPHNHADQNWPLPEDIAGSVLIVSERAYELARIRDDFGTFEARGEIVIPTGRGRQRRFTLWEATDHDRIPRTAEYEAEQVERDAAFFAGE